MNPSNHKRPQRIEDRTVSRRSEPSSRTTLIGEQPNPWDLLQPQDVMSRHRGAKPRRRCERLGAISLLSLAYLLSYERWRFHIQPPDHLNLLSQLLDLLVSVKLPYTHALYSPITDRAEGTFVILRYSLGGFRPRKTDLLSMSLAQIMGRG